jgi:CxxC motif-containing protein
MAKEFICIVCPRGCHVSVDDLGKITGNQCKRGETYVINEMTNPKRVLTTTVKTIFPEVPRASVKTKEAIPKGLIYQAMALINQVVIEKEMHIGEVIIPNILNTGVDVVLTKEIRRKEER